MLSFGILGVANPTALSNFLWWIPGVAQIAVIINIPSVIVSSSVFMIILGSIMLVFGFLGCGGVLCGSKWLLFFVSKERQFRTLNLHFIGKKSRRLPQVNIII